MIDVRAKTTEPAAQSEDQEDELLSIVPIKGYETIFNIFFSDFFCYFSERPGSFSRYCCVYPPPSSF